LLLRINVLCLAQQSLEPREPDVLAFAFMLPLAQHGIQVRDVVVVLIDELILDEWNEPGWGDFLGMVMGSRT
jgi:hypothetical protein